MPQSFAFHAHAQLLARALKAHRDAAQRRIETATRSGDDESAQIAVLDSMAYDAALKAILPHTISHRAAEAAA